MDEFGPAVLVHVVAHIGVAGLLFLLQPVVEVALDGIGGDGHASALLEDDAGEFEAGHGVLQILAEVAEVGALLLGVSVIFPEGGDDLAVGGLGAPVVDQQGDDLFGACIFECDGLSVYKKFKVSEGLGKDALVAVFADGVAEIIKLFFHAVGLRGLENIAAGVELEGIVAVFGTVRKIDQVDLGIEIPEVLAQKKAIQLGHIGLQKGDINHLLSGCGECGQAALMGQNLCFGKEDSDVFFGLFQ